MKHSFVFSLIFYISVYLCFEAKSGVPDHVTLTWTGDARTTQTITWRTDINQTKGEVRFANIVDSAHFLSTAITVKEDSSGNFKTDIGVWFIHTVTLKNLEPGKTYCYTVGYGNNWSTISTFATESNDTKNFRFLIFGDSQSGEAKDTNYTIFSTTINNAYSKNPDSKFFINMGDLVEVGGYYIHWNNWFESVKDVINKIPAMPILGNHDTYKDSIWGGGSEKPKYFIRQFKVSQQNVPDELKGQIYSFDYGEVHFAIWDSQIREEKFSDATIKKELDWLRKDLKSTDKKWKIVLFHKPIYYNSAFRSNDKLKTLLQPIIDSNHVDIVLNAHEHMVSWTYPIKADTFVVKPSQGTVYYLTGRSGNKWYNDTVAKVWNAYTYNPQEMPNYILAETNGNQFKLTVFKQDGTPIDTCVIDKSKDEVLHGSSKIKLPEKYKEPTVVLFGSVSKADKAELINNKWYLPADIIKKYWGYNFIDYKSLNMLMFSKDGKK